MLQLQMCKIEEKVNTKSNYELQDIFNLYGDSYTSNHNLTLTQQKAISDISICRTSKLGFNAKLIPQCMNLHF